MTENKYVTKKFLLNLLIKVGNKMELTSRDRNFMKKYFKKLCSKCKGLKKYDKYSPMQSGRFGLSGYCKDCNKEISKSHYDEVGKINKKSKKKS